MPGYVEIILPASIDAVVGKEFNLYNSSILATENPLNAFRIVYESSTGQTNLNGYSFMPGGPGAVSVTIKVYYGATLVKQKTVTINVRANSGTVRKVLIQGDSNFEQPGLDAKKTIVTENAGAFTFVGERTKDDDATLIKHEATYGWSLAQYLTEGDTTQYYKVNVTGVTLQTYALLQVGSAQFQMVRKVLDGSGNGYLILLKYNGTAIATTSGTLSKISGHSGDASFAYTGAVASSPNPFWNGGALNISTYLSRNSITLGANDAWIIHLATNGLQFHTSDADDTSFASSFVAQLIQMKNAIRAASANVNILICITIPSSELPNALQPTNTLWRYERAWKVLTMALITEFDKSAYITDKIKVVALNAGLDRVYGFHQGEMAESSREATTVLKGIDAIHMGASGQQQAADIILAALRSL